MDRLVDGMSVKRVLSGREQGARARITEVLTKPELDTPLKRLCRVSRYTFNVSAFITDDSFSARPVWWRTLALGASRPVRVGGRGRVGVQVRGVQVRGVRHRCLGQVPGSRAPPNAVCRTFAALFRRRSSVVRTPATTSATRLAFTTSATFAALPATPTTPAALPASDTAFAAPAAAPPTGMKNVAMLNTDSPAACAGSEAHRS